MEIALYIILVLAVIIQYYIGHIRLCNLERTQEELIRYSVNKKCDKCEPEQIYIGRIIKDGKIVK